MGYAVNYLATYTNGNRMLLRGETQRSVMRAMMCNSTLKDRGLDYWEVLDHAAAMRVVFAEEIEVTYVL